MITSANIHIRQRRQYKFAHCFGVTYLSFPYRFCGSGKVRVPIQ